MTSNGTTLPTSYYTGPACIQGVSYFNYSLPSAGNYTMRVAQTSNGAVTYECVAFAGVRAQIANLPETNMLAVAAAALFALLLASRKRLKQGRSKLNESN